MASSASTAAPQLTTQPGRRAGWRVEVIEREQRRADDRRMGRQPDRGARRDGLDPARNGLDQGLVLGPQQPAAEHDVDRLAVESEPLDRHPHERNNLAREPAGDRAGDGVLRGKAQHERRELDEPSPRYPPLVDRLPDVVRPGQPEVPRDSVLEQRARAAPVRAAGGSRQRGEADVVPATPVAGDRAEGRPAGDPPVRRDADPVDARAADDRDAPSHRPDRGRRRRRPRRPRRRHRPNGDLLLDPVRSILAGRLAYPPRVAVSSLGEAAVLTGALAVGLRTALERVFAERARPERRAG
jgi:hypothetical protein